MRREASISVGWLWFFGSTLSLVSAAAMLWLGGSKNGPFQFNYSLDDAYIHLAISKNLAQNGVWGMTPDAFSSSSSSILWTLLLAGCIKIFGAHVWLPLALNAIFSIGLIWVWAKILARWAPSRFAAAIALSVWIFLLSVPHLVLIGMEHTLQSMLFATFFLLLTTDVLDLKSPKIWLLGLAFFATSVRYEGIFFAAAASISLFLEKKYRFAILLMTVAVLPAIAFGIWSVQQGGFFSQIRWSPKRTSPICRPRFRLSKTH